MISNYPPGVTGNEPQIAGDVTRDKVADRIMELVSGKDCAMDDEALDAIVEYVIAERDGAYSQGHHEPRRTGPVIWDRLPIQVRSDLMERWHPASESECRARALHLSDRELLDEWLCWNGIVGYTNCLIRALDGIREARED